LLKEARKKEHKNAEAEGEDVKKKKVAEMELLVGEKRNGVSQDFKANPLDKRFTSIIEGDKDFAIDPTHKNFRKIAGGEFIKEQNNKRMKLHHE